MKPAAREWVKKAEGDFFTCLREHRARKNPNYDSACFHAQQCIEKYLKARLQISSKNIPRIHDLGTLLKLCSNLEPLWMPWLDDLKTLTYYAVETRYPGETTTKKQAATALKITKLVRAEIRASLGLKS